jgi:hypothetical protein
MFLSEFTESKIELVGHILVIDGKRYINRGLWLIHDIDSARRLVYKDEGKENALFGGESVSFQEVDLIPLFFDKERGF